MEIRRINDQFDDEITSSVNALMQEQVYQKTDIVPYGDMENEKSKNLLMKPYENFAAYFNQFKFQDNVIKKPHKKICCK